MRKPCVILLCLALIDYATTSPAAGVFQQDRIVVADNDVTGGNLHVIDMDARTDVIVPGVTGWLVAANQENVFLMHQQTEFVRVTTILDMRTDRVETIERQGSLGTAWDIDATAEGVVYLTSEFGVGGHNPRTGERFPVERIQFDNNFRSIEVDSTGTVITDFSEYPRPNDPDRGDPGNTKVTHIVRQRPGVDEPEIIQLDVILQDYALASDNELIGLCSCSADTEMLYRIDLNTGSSELIRSELLDGNGFPSKVVVDSQGRAIVMRNLALANQDRLVQLVRFDPFNGTTDIMDLDFPAISPQFDVIPEIAPALMAGDADLDLDFDQFDLVKVQATSKYLTGQPATWGEGDWNRAPGGSVSYPPAGNRLFDQMDIIAALSGAAYLTGPYAAIAQGGVAGDGQTSVIYDPSTGELAVDAPAGTDLTSINIDSAAGIFTGDAAENLGGSFDNDADSNIFKATFGSSFGSLSFGHVAQTGLSKETLLGDLSVVGSVAGGGDLGPVDLIYVPEPSTLALLILGLLTCTMSHRSTHCTINSVL